MSAIIMSAIIIKRKIQGIWFAQVHANFRSAIMLIDADLNIELLLVPNQNAVCGKKSMPVVLSMPNP